ncbi:MAG: SpaA isopeptide-forming pilin-related protein [Methanomassiliicoccales archaeon]|nr:SpaA isopeptide-forming pilin-related protein [Methanomassiliicoccales archaeon]
MDAVGGTDSESTPSAMRYFTVKNLPWEAFMDGYVIFFFRAHLSLSIIWMADLEKDLPQALDGNEFEGWTGISPHNGSSYASGASRHFTVVYPGVGGKTIPIPITDYPKDVINVRKFINNVPYNNWLMHLEGKLSLWGTTGEGYVYIPYCPQPVLTGAGPWALGYCAFDALPRGNYTVWEEGVGGYILRGIGTNPDLHLYNPGKLQYFDAATETLLDNPDVNFKVRFDMERGTWLSPKTEIIDFYNLAVGNISGYKIHDVNGDGTVDAGESGLAGWTIELYELGGISPVATTTTNDTGYFEFANVLVGDYTVKEIMQEGWYNTSPISENVCIGCASEITDIMFLNTMYSSICGNKVEDINGNGVQDANDTTIANWEIWLYKNSEHVNTTHTDETGHFCFDMLTPGNYTVEEQVPAGWYYTDVQSYTFNLISNSHERVTFLNTEKVSICGYKFEDMNGDGVWNEGTDLGLPGWTIYLFNGTIEAGEQPFKTTTTDSTGYFCFSGLPVGEYTVKEQMKSGWYNTSKDEVTISLTSGESKSIMFLNTEKVHICGFKYEDMNGNGTWDEGDLGLPGWTIYLFNGTIEAGEQPFKTTTTVSGGGFCFHGLPVGTYTVKEEMQSGWYATSDEEVTVSLTSGGSTCVEFLNTHLGQICVFKYDDLNGNGTWEQGEPGVAGVLMELFEGTIGIDESPIATGTTNSTGYVCFTGLTLGTYTVRENPLQGTYPSNGTTNVAVIDQSNETVRISFGNIEVGRICVYKYEDENGNGVRDAGEDTLVGGVHVELWKGGVMIGCGSTSGCPCHCLCFYNLVFGTYIVNETVPEGWYNTTSAEVEVVIDQSGEHVGVTFLNTEYSSISGYKLQDIDGDGYADASDTPIENWEIQLWRDGHLVDTNLTNETGHFCFDMLVPGNYTVIEETRTGWYNTTPDEIPVTIVSGDHVNSVLFLNTEYSSICGYKVEDLNGDGQQTGNETGLSNWEIRLYKLNEEVPTSIVVSSYVLVATNFTDENGRFCFTNLTPGQYLVEEVMQAGWYNTSPINYTVEISSGNHVERVFLNTEMGRICGYKVEDLNGNGSWDEDELGVQGWYIELRKDEEYYNSTLTGADGSFCFTNLTPGEYVVYEGYDCHWYNTSATYVEVSISSGVVVNDVVFLNVRYGQICVYKYEDENGNGVRDEGENTLVNGVFIELLLDGQGIRSGYTGQCPCMVRLGQICVFKYQDMNGNGEKDANEPVQAGVTIQLWSNGSMIASGVTGEDGKVCFTNLTLGDYIVNETVPTGWYATNGTSFNVTIDESGQYIELTFLNTEYGQICVYKYEDENGNGVRDEGENTLVNGVTVVLMDACGAVIGTGVTGDNGTGKVCFTNLTLGTYYVEETAWPSGWYSTDATMKEVCLETSGASNSTFFLNTQYGHICVYKYEDENGNGVRDEGENTLVNGVFIELLLDGQGIRSGYTGQCPCMATTRFVRPCPQDTTTPPPPR